MEAAITDLTHIIDLMKKQSGIIFTQDKAYVILTKLYPLIEKYHFNNIEELLLAVKKNITPTLITDVIDILTINETSFYRDRYPFEALDRDIIPEILKNDPTKKELKILCAACSTGQEPYSLAMHFLEHKQYQLGCKITAIDLSNTVIDKAKSGIYNQFEIQRGLPITLLVKYFTQVDKDWMISNEIKQQVTFRQFNLMSDLSTLGKFDIIFCRNVLIYFNEQLRKQVISNLTKVMNSNGAVLILGGAESIPYENQELHKITDYNGIYSNIAPQHKPS